MQQTLADALGSRDSLSPVPGPTTASGSHVRLPTAALISAPLRWGSVGKHLFPRPTLLHLSGVAASACKQGGANGPSPEFFMVPRQSKQTNWRILRNSLLNILTVLQATSVAKSPQL
ncbi:hypothetical protein VZT92_021765 [Zoarces viviparus]|uniref:Uncharacterized protein n=1 Tax=Zoarces viviparus TaxID=48416 RepID=A0AAW1EA21_ZOAVI